MGFAETHENTAFSISRKETSNMSESPAPMSPHELAEEYLVYEICYALSLRTTGTDELIELLQKEIRSLESVNHYIKFELDRIKTDMEFDIPVTDSDGLKYIDRSTEIVYRMEKILKEKGFLNYRHLIGKSFEDTLEKHGCNVKNPFNIKVFLKGNLMFIRTPLLKKRHVPLSTDFNCSYHLRRHPNPFDDTVSELINEEKMTGNFQFSLYDRCTLQYLFVSNNSSLISDADNYDTDTLTNVITRNTPCGDAPSHCRFVLDSVLTNALEEGTYITLLPSEMQPLTVENIINIWSEKDD